MTQLPIDQAIPRFAANEERVDVFVNDPSSVGYYETNETTPRQVESLPHLIERIAERHLNVVFKGDWLTTINYSVNDLVEETDVVYICVESHTSGVFATDLSAGKWAVYQGNDASNINYTPPFTGAVARTQHDKNTEYVSVKDFGAIGNGIADDSDAFQKALDASNNIIVNEGNYLVTKSVIKNGNCINLIGIGKPTIICSEGSFKFGNFTTLTGGFTTTTPVYENLKISGIIFDGLTDNTNSLFVQIVGYRNISINDCSFVRFKYEGLYFGCGNENVSIENCIFDEGNNTVESKGLTITHISPDYGTGIPISGSSFDVILSQPSTLSKYFNISNCKFVKTRIQVSNISNISINNCVFIDIRTRGINFSPWVYNALVNSCIFNGTPTTSTGVNCSQYTRNIVISNNLFTSTISASGMARNISVYYNSECMIIGNKFRNSATRNITISVNSTAVILNNIFESSFRGGDDILCTSKDFFNGDPTHGETATIANANSKVIVNNNIFYAPKARCVYIKGEKATSNSNALPLSGSSIGNNTIYDYYFSRIAYGDAAIRIDSDKGAVSDIYLDAQHFNRTSSSVPEILLTTSYFEYITSGGSIAFRERKGIKAVFKLDLTSGSVITTKVSGPNECSLAAVISGTSLSLTPKVSNSRASAYLDFSRVNSGVGFSRITSYPSASPFFTLYDFSGAALNASLLTCTIYAVVFSEYNG